MRPEGWGGWADLLDGYSTASDSQISRRDDDYTRLMPIITSAAKLRGEGGGWR